MVFYLFCFVLGIFFLIWVYSIIRWMLFFGQFLLLRYVTYPLVLSRAYYSSVTRLQVALLLVYIGANALCMGLRVHTALELSFRCGMMASINIVPLFFGGRTSFIADRLRIPLHIYYFIHHWIGRMATLQGLLHMILSLVASKTDSISSGVPLSVALECLTVFSIYPFRRSRFELFLKSHFILSFLVLGLLFWHLLPGDFGKIIYPVAAISLWSINAILRIANMLYHNSGEANRNQQAVITKYHQSIPGLRPLSDRRVDALRLQVELKRPMAITPGQYIYLNTHDLRLRHRIQSHPFAIMWWTDAQSNNDPSVTNFTLAKNLVFLVEPRSGLTDQLTRESALSHLVLDGPYGHALCVEQYETVMLAAKGIGIAGVISYAKQLLWWASSKTQKRRVLTRKLDLYWELDDNNQEKWVGAYLRELQEKNDALTTPLLQLWCYFPSSKQSKPMIELSVDKRRQAYRYFYPGDSDFTTIETAISTVAGMMPGTSIVVACGCPEFTTRTRAAAIDATNKDNVIRFAEVEYRPSIPSKSVGSPTRDVELGDLDLKPLVSHPIRINEHRGALTVGPQAQEF